MFVMGLHSLSLSLHTWMQASTCLGARDGMLAGMLGAAQRVWHLVQPPAGCALPYLCHPVQMHHSVNRCILNVCSTKVPRRG